MFVSYISYLLAKKSIPEPADFNPKKDLILKFIGGVSHSSLAKEIEKELHGR